MLNVFSESMVLKIANIFISTIDLGEMVIVLNFFLNQCFCKFEYISVSTIHLGEMVMVRLSLMVKLMIVTM